MTLVTYRPQSYLDFSNPELRQAQQQAIDLVAGQFGRRYPLLVGGEEVWTDGAIRSASPIQPDRVVGEVASAGLSEALKALEAASAAFPAWSRTSADARARVLVKAAAIVKRRRLEFNAWLIHEVGKTWTEADAETAEAIDFLEYYARQMLRLAAPQPMTPIDGEENELSYLPLGVGVVHPPFNFPLAIMAGMVCAAAVAGNAVVLKPSAHAPVVAAQFMAVLAEAGMPAGVVNYLPGDPALLGDVLTTHPLVRFVNFTGSAAVGATLYEKAARLAPNQHFFRRFIGEMGGKDGIVVADDADPDAAALGIMQSAFGYSGQKCSACSRVIADARIYDELLARTVAMTAELKLGLAFDPETQMGTLVSQAALDKALRYAEIGRREGRLILGGAQVTDLPGYVVAPTIIADVAPNARLAQEEVFGPVLAFIRANSYAEALSIANDTPYGLTGAIYTRSRNRVEQARREFHVGNLYVNRKCTGALVGVQPFGGLNMSGTNTKAGGPDYLTLFMQMKSVSERF